ncbi:hemerythrin domain-containing protein [Geofilum rhodophaeum]|uniref:hemerythrin domain-containing protein n=1 Tax=Geofilum rhodophaeum TaxID=1965019 RepID=UPI000B523159|nr:hemerythrin domain-containing protein [Geofilum rhodophaeum]
MRIHADMKMADLVHLNFEVLAVVQRLQIPFGFKDKTISDVCREHNINVDFFLQLVQWFNERENFPQEQLIQGDAQWLVRYLHHTHQCYLNYQIPRIEKEIEFLEQLPDMPDHSARLMLEFFREYIREFTEHIEDEENTTFPYILALGNTLSGNMDLETFRKRYKTYTIDKYLEHHSDLEEKVFDLQSILLRHLPPPSSNCHFTNLLLEISRLGNDLKDHTLLEENVLIPKARQMELELNQGSTNQ